MAVSPGAVAAIIPVSIAVSVTITGIPRVVKPVSIPRVVIAGVPGIVIETKVQ
jgi:hypothetical protein